MTATDAISDMTPEQKRLFLRYGDHARGCAWRKWVENNSAQQNRSWADQRFYPQPDCDCGWLEALAAACGGEGC